MGKGLRFVMLNVRSLWPNIDELRLNFENYDVIGICESWLNENVTDAMIDFPGFEIIRQDRCSGKRGGGLLLYVRCKYIEHCNNLGDLSMMTNDLEQLWVTFSIPNVRKVNIGLIYRPPGSTLETSIEELRHNIEFVTTNNNHENIIMGDFNINYKLRHSHPYKLIKEIEQDFGLKQLINEDTRITSRSSTLIDLILTDCQYIEDSGVLNICISDHCAVYMVKKKPRLKYTRVEHMWRSYKHYDKIEMQNSVKAHDERIQFWENDKNIDIMWNTILRIIGDCANLHCPLVQVKIPENSPIWFTREIIEEIVQKDHLYLDAKRLGTQEAWKIFKDKKKEVKTILLNAKENYIKDQINTQQNDPRKFWRNVNKVSGIGNSNKKSGLKKIFRQ